MSQEQMQEMKAKMDQLWMIYNSVDVNRPAAETREQRRLTIEDIAKLDIAMTLMEEDMERE